MTVTVIKKPLSIRLLKKRLTIPTVVLTVLALFLSLPALSVTARAGFDNFVYKNNYISGQFTDVSDTDWYARYVEDAYNFGFLRGKSETIFDPAGNLTLGEAVTLAARLMSLYNTGKTIFPESVPYYAAYANYALEHGIIDKHMEYTATATRAQLVKLFYRVFPPEAFPEINKIADYGICDVTPDSDCGKAVYAFYRAGILTGSDRYGTFFSDSQITRAETCALMVRLADPAFRVATVLPSRLPAEVIYERSVDAIFMLEMFDAKGVSIRTGSGFFITETGLAVTNLHVIENAASATITLQNGEVYPVKGAVATSEEFNLVILSVDSEKGGWSYLNLADSDLVAVGSIVYCIGSPRSLLNAMTEGVISKTLREVSDDTLIQFTAPISFGSGGSPVLNTLGHVVGLASSSYTYGQNLNLAVPVNHLKTMEPGPCISLEELLRKTP